MLSIPEYVSDLVKNIAATEGFENYTTKLESGANHGDNFVGVMVRIILSGNRHVNGNYEHNELKLLCKIGSDVAERRKQFNTDALFLREIFVYEKLLPAFREFQKSKGLGEAESFVSYPKYYVGLADVVKGHFVIIMEDLREKKFDMWPKKKLVPLDHSRLVMEQLGRFHGISLAMKEQQPNVFEEFSKLDDVYIGVIRTGMPMFQSAFDMAMDAVTDDEHKRILQHLKDNVLEIMTDVTNAKKAEPFTVVSHGDCWNNNQMFQYQSEANRSPSTVCLIDWQIARYCSPALDLHYYLFSATDHESRAKDYENLLHIYHSSLTDIVQKLGSDPQKLFTFDDLQNQLKKFGKFSLVMSPILIQIMMADAKDVNSMDDLSQKIDGESEETVTLVTGYDADTQIVYNKRILELMNDVVNMKLFWH